MSYISASGSTVDASWPRLFHLITDIHILIATVTQQRHGDWTNSKTLFGNQKLLNLTAELDNLEFRFWRIAC